MGGFDQALKRNELKTPQGDALHPEGCSFSLYGSGVGVGLDRDVGNRLVERAIVQ